MVIPPRPDLPRPPTRGARFLDQQRRLMDLPRSARLGAVAISLGPLLAWFVGCAVAAARQMPFPTAAVGSLFAVGVFVTLPAALLTRRHLLRTGRAPRLWVGLLASLIAILVPIGLGSLPAFGLPDPTPVPGDPAIYGSASPYGNLDIWFMRGGGDVRDGTITPVLSTPASEGDVALSPDGSTLVFASDTEGTFDLWMLYVDDGVATGAPRRLTFDERGHELAPAWSPDGSTIAFTSRVGDDTDVLLLSVPDGAVTPLTNDGDSYGPSWAPGGRVIAISRPTYDEPDDDALWVVPIAGGDATLLADTPGDDSAARWADASQFAFTSASAGQADVYWGRWRGDDPMNLTPGTPGSDDFAFGIGPQGHVLFLSDRAPTPGTFFYFMGSDGSGVTLAGIA